MSTPSEPIITPEFAERYRAVMQAWQTGDATAKHAEASLENLLEEAQQDDNPMHMGTIELHLGIIEGYVGNLVASARHFELARQQFISANADRSVITCDLNIGEVYRLQGNFTRAQKFFHRAYEDGKRLNHPRTMATALTNEGQLWLSMNSLLRASKCLSEAVELSKEPYADEDELIHIARLGILAEVYHALTQIALIEEDHETAWLYAKQSYDYGKQTNQPMRLGFGNRALADALTALGHVPDGDFENNPDAYYKIALSNFKQVKVEGDIAKTLYAHGNSLHKRGRNTAAAKLYQRALAIFSKLGMTDDAAKVAEAQMKATF